MVYLTEPPVEVNAIYQAVPEANQCAHQTTIAGLHAHTVDHAARNSLERAVYAYHFLHCTDHGLGLETHEPPWIPSEGDTILELGMVFSIWPGVYLQGRFGIRIEDIVEVTEDKCRVLTGLDHELIINT